VDDGKRSRRNRLATTQRKTIQYEDKIYKLEARRAQPYGTKNGEGEKAGTARKKTWEAIETLMTRTEKAHEQGGHR